MPCFIENERFRCKHLALATIDWLVTGGDES